MNRRQILTELIATLEKTESITTWIAEPIDMIKAVERYRRKNNYPEKTELTAKNGCLYANGKMIIRYAVIPKTEITEAGDYWENRILERQEL